MGIKLPEDGVLFELNSGELSATVILAGNLAMQHDPGPTIHETFDEKRVIVSFNKKAYKWRVKKLVDHFAESRAYEDREVLEKECQNQLHKSYLAQTIQALQNHFESKGLDGFGEQEDEV